MKVLNEFNALGQFGINVLTGEACKFGMRLLCDLSEEGADLVRRFFGAPDMDCFPPNWNNYMPHGGQPVASVLLPRSVMHDLMVFALFTVDGCSEVILCPGRSIVGVLKTDEYRTRYLELAQNDSRYTVMTHPSNGSDDRNNHLFSGRTV